MNSSLKAFLNVNLSFLPLIFFWSISNELGIILGFSAALMLFIRGIINKNIGIMVGTLFVYCTIFNILYFYFKMDFFMQYKYLTSYVMMALMGLISIILRKPYTMYEARCGYSTEFSESDLFIEVNIAITKIWTIIYSINGIIELTGHNIVTIIIMNGFVGIGIILSIMIPRAFPDV